MLSVLALLGCGSADSGGAPGPDGRDAAADVRAARWVTENHGVEPTVPVDDLPEDVLAGRDPQLDTAVCLVLDRIREEPRDLPPPPKDLPPYPPEGR